MARAARDDDFNVDVDGIGKFVFGYRRMEDQIKIHVEYARITAGVEPTPWLDLMGTWLSALRVLIVRNPEGFDVDSLDPLDPETEVKIRKVFEALREKERSFRRKPAPPVEGGGKAAISDP